MNVEESRLRTFTDWPANAAVDAARIAKAGFYYTGHAVEVQCFLCGVKISDWNYGDQAIVRHRLAEPNCPFVQNSSSTCNVPLIPISNNNSGLASSSTEMLQDNITVEHRSISRCQNKEPQKEYRVMSQRLQSFTNWPVSSVISPENLAKAGFYYLQHDDKVQCAYCGGILKEWQPGENPDKEHRKFFPDCDFYVYQDKDDNLHLTNVKLTPGTTSSLSELGIHTHTTPKKPDHATYEGRLHTFNGWPENLKQTPEVLASAGFYYNGFGDLVTCFHCDGSLRNWETTDDAWTEHARWFPKCEFVNLIRGQEFIRQCINSRPPLDQSIFEGVTEDENINSTEVPPTSSSTMLSPSLEVTEAALEKLLETSPAIVALEIDRIKRALKIRMEELEISCTNFDQLINQLIYIFNDQVVEKLTRVHNQPSDSTSKLTTLFNHVVKTKTNDDIKQCDNIENDKYVLCSIKQESSKPSSNKSSTLDKEININFKEAVSLEEENRKLKEARLCKICMDREVAVVFLPCGHLATCVYCAPSLTYCPMCRQEIKATVRIFLS